MRILVAGAGGVVGRHLLPLLVRAGHVVSGTTRSKERTASIEAAGGLAVVVDVLERARLLDVVAEARPDVVIHQLTDLGVPDAAALDQVRLASNARLREEGTANLIEAAATSGARRLVAQSVAWLYAPGPEPHTEEHPLLPLDASASVTLRGVHALERAVVGDARLEGIVLRYGRFHGHGTWHAEPPQPPTVGVAAAAHAAALAVDRGVRGVYNVVDDDGPVSNAKARTELGWEPDFGA